MKIRFLETGTGFFKPEVVMLLRIVTLYPDWSVSPSVFDFVLSEFSQLDFGRLWVR